MASENTPINFQGGPNFSQRLWSEEVAIARANGGESLDPNEVAYVFSNGQRFNEPKRPL